MVLGVIQIPLENLPVRWKRFFYLSDWEFLANALKPIKCGLECQLSVFENFSLAFESILFQTCALTVYYK